VPRGNCEVVHADLLLAREFEQVIGQTGGFSEVLAARGARRIYAVDVGTGQIHPRVAARSEIVSMEQTDIRTLDPAQLAEPPDFAAESASDGRKSPEGANVLE
jgi:hypothetical protein